LHSESVELKTETDSQFQISGIRLQLRRRLKRRPPNQIRCEVMNRPFQEAEQGGRPQAVVIISLPMTKTYAQIQKQIETLQREADKLKRKEVEGVIARIREAIQVYGLTAQDLGLPSAPRRGRSAGAAKSGRRAGRASTEVRFRDEAGNTWGGRGPRPRWLREALASGKQLSDFAV
jgi:DNA-binding protein H-NS